MSACVFGIYRLYMQGLQWIVGWWIGLLFAMNMNIIAIGGFLRDGVCFFIAFIL